MEDLLVTPETLGFNVRQIVSMENAKLKRERMKLLVSNLTQLKQDEKYSNVYIYSPPGLGKTHTVNECLRISDLIHFLVSGNTSMFAFGIQLAVINYLNQEMKPVVIYVDDCDEIFKNDQNCNTMKKVLDREQCFTYEKSLASQWSSLSETQKDAIKFFGEEGKMGFAVPTYNMRFIFTSNLQLPFDDEVAEARKKNKSKAILMAHRNAIRSRCKVGDFDLSLTEHWGWIADVVMSSDILNDMILSEDQKFIILNFMWYKWSFMKERSIRVIEKMLITMKLYPETYTTVWEIDYLKTNTHGQN
jgi:hypothetical protein